LVDCFSVIVAAEDVSKGKPDPEGYLLSATLVGDKIRSRLEPGDCLVIEDAPLVAKSVRTVGFPVLGVATTHSMDKFEDANWTVKSLHPDDPYVTVSESRAWDALRAFAKLPPRLAHYTLRHACGLPPVLMVKWGKRETHRIDLARS